MKLVERSYWEALWQTGPLPPSFDPKLPGLRHHLKRRFDRYFQEVFAGTETRGRSFLEVGCGRSQLLPYFAKAYGFHVRGIDYSPTGCETARAILEREGVTGPILEADLFNPPSELLGQADVVFSYGLAEHFDRPSECLRALSALLRHGGVIVTLIPNMTGLVGVAQRWLNRPVFDIHNPMDREGLLREHELAGLEVVRADYLMSVNFGVCSLMDVPRSSLRGISRHVIWNGLLAFTAAAWQVERLGVNLPRTKRMSPYVACVARKN